MSFVTRTLKRATGYFVWRNRPRAVQMLLAFGRTEAGGGVDITRAAHRAKEAELRKHLLRHAEDEVRHAAMFRNRARELFGDGRDPAPETAGSDLLPAGNAGSERGSLALTDHGFVPSDNSASLSDTDYVAMLYLAEVQAAEDFTVHRDLTKDRDPKTAAVFESILRDERYHVAWTKSQLQTWREAGRGNEVRRSLRRMRWARFKAQYSQLLWAISNGIGSCMMSLLYLTVFLPFGLLSRIGAMLRKGGWKAPHRPLDGTLSGLRTQA